MKSKRIDEIDTGGRPMSRWHIIYGLAVGIGAFTAINAIHVVRYWGTITSLAGEVGRCVVALR
jgi:hypothetical protein